MHRAIDRGMTLPQFIALARRQFNMSHVELCQIHFASTEKAYLAELRTALATQAIQVSSVPIDCAVPGVVDREKRLKNVTTLIGWLDVAAELGALAARVNTGGDQRDERTVDAAIEAYALLAQAADERRLDLLIENHWGLSSDPNHIIRIIREVNHPRLKTCPDLGNFDEAVRYDGLSMLRPYAGTVHIKSYRFDAQGNELGFDFARAIEPFLDFTGVFCIEFEGDEADSDTDEVVGVTQSIRLLERYVR
jgi:sugar phosphate isomerase/epimerase